MVTGTRCVGGSSEKERGKQSESIMLTGMDLPYGSIKASLIITINNLSLSIVDMLHHMSSIVAFTYYSK